MEAYDDEGNAMSVMEMFDEMRMKELLNKPGVDHVRVFSLTPDQKAEIEKREAEERLKELDRKLREL